MATRHVSFEAVGFEKIRKQFNQLPIKVADKVMKGAVKQGSSEWEKRMAWMAPRALGHLRKSMMVKVVQYRGGLKTVGITGPRSEWIPVSKAVRWTRRGKVNPAIYAKVTNKGKHAGSNQGWRERAFTLGKGVAQKRFQTFLIRGLRREAKKLGFKSI